MTYETAKKLYESGLSVDTNKRPLLSTCLEHCDKESLIEPLDSKNGKYHKYLFVCKHFVFPTLSELIAACGDSFGTLERYNGDFEIGYVLKIKWLVRRKFGVSDSDIPVEGETPEEAVAKLWLALNEKSRKP